MSWFKSRDITLLAAVMVVSLATLVPYPSPTAFADEPLSFQPLIDQYAESIVPVKYITKLTLGGRGASNEQEIDSEVFGVMIDPQGTVLCANSQLDGFAGLLKRMMGRGTSGVSITSDINSIQVLVGADEQEMDAEILARDPELDLAWIQIKEPNGSYKAIDLAQTCDPALGAKVVSLSRLGKYFDRVPLVQTAVICGQTVKPRKLWITQESFSSCLGLPVFTEAGKLVGIAVRQLPPADEEGSGESQMISRMMSMLSSEQSAQDLNAMVLPASDAAKATARARDAAKVQADDK